MAKLKLTDKIVTNTYEVAGHSEFFIDIVENRYRHVWDAYLWHMSYGVKARIFGSDTETLPLEGFKQVMLSGIEDDIKDYIEMYAPELLEG